MRRVFAMLLILVLTVSVLACSNGGNNGSADSTEGTGGETAQSGNDQAASDEAEATNAEASDEQVTLRFAWWGSEERTNATLKAIDLFTSKHPNIKFETEYGGWDGFTQKSKAQVIAGEAPDLLLNEFWWGIDPSNYEDLKKYPVIRTDKIDQNLLQSATIDGELKGLPTAIATDVVIYNKTLFQKLGVKEPETNWTWDDFAATAKEIYEKSNGQVHGTLDMKYADTFYDQMHAMTGKPVYSEKGIVYSDEDAKQVLQFWKDLRDKGYATPPEVTAAADDNQNSPFVTGKAAMLFTVASVFGRYQNSVEDELEMAPIPNGPYSGNAATLEVFLAINKQSKHKEEAAMFLDFFINDLEANNILRTVRGVSANSEVRQMLASQPDIDPVTKKLLNVTSRVYDNLPIHERDPIPEGYSEFHEGDNAIFIQALQKLQFSKITVDEAVKEIREKGERLFNQ